MSGAFDFTAQEWSRLRSLLDEALDLEPARRADWLERLDERGHATLKPRLASLLGGDDPAATVQRLLNTLPRVETDQFAHRLPGVGGESPGEAVGPYRLIRELGSGGMASVWLAERTDMLQRRQVALKLPHGAWRRAGLAERMAREREILATLEHPCIARLYDAGVAEDGQPFLALEYVEGERIDAYALRQALDVPARLRLFLQVVRAVAYAHAQLVVHRDLKPSNILVTAAGEVKLLDFGIAKLLDQGVAAETELTREAGRALTPEYAAPEQILGKPVGTAADVYALGVLLFEMLAEARPYKLDRASRAALEEVILRADPPRPSSVAPWARRKALRGDLDTIVAKALKKEPAQRYATAEALADDVLRHLAHRPVAAQPDSAAYRLRKFVARNRLGVSAACAVVLAVIAGGGVAAWQARVAWAEQRRALAEADLARRAERIANANTTLADFLVSDLAVGRSASDLVAQIERAAQMVRVQYRDNDLVRAHLLGDLGGRFRRLGEWDRYRATSAEAEQAARAAGDTELLAKLGCRRARDMAQAGDVAAARTLVRDRIGLLERTSPQPTAVLVSCLADASAVARVDGDAAEAIRTAERIRDLETAAGIQGSATFADTLMILARAYALAGRYDDGIAAADAAVALHRKVGTDATPAALNAAIVLSTVLRDGGQPLRALDVQDRLLADHAARGGDRRTLALVVAERAGSLLALGRNDEAIAQLETALADVRALGDDASLRAGLCTLVTAQARAGQLGPARQNLAEAQRLFAAPLAQRGFAARLPLLAQAELALAEGDPVAARAALDAAVAIIASRPGASGAAAARAAEALGTRLAARSR